MEKGLKIRLYPNKNQISLLNIIFGHARFVYNYFLDYSKRTKDYKYTNWSKILTDLKNSDSTSFLKDADKFALQNSLRNLATAYENFFSKRTNEPVFKKSIMNNPIEQILQIIILYYMRIVLSFLN